MVERTRDPWEKAFKEENGRYPNDLDRLAKSNADTRNILRNVINKIETLDGKIDLLLRKLDNLD